MRVCSRVSLGLVIGIPAIAVLVAILLSAVVRWRAEALRIRSRNNLNQIARALAMYLDRFGGSYPPCLGVLVDKGLLPAKTLLLPVDHDPPMLPNGLRCSYEYNPEAPKWRISAARDEPPPNEPIAWERKAFLRDGQSVVFADSHVEFVTEPWTPPCEAKK